jgi:hypothetical protein
MKLTSLLSLASLLGSAALFAGIFVSSAAIGIIAALVPLFVLWIAASDYRGPQFVESATTARTPRRESMPLAA